MNISSALISAGGSIIVGVLALIGVMITNNSSNKKMQNEMRTAQAVTDERIDELTREVRTHNDFASRIPVLEEKIKTVNRRISDLENYHKPN
jgi:uncharacterized protein YlxW (UPF0749 family)